MKKIFASIALIALSLGAFAQNSEFTPGWYGYVKGGVGYTVGETTNNNLITPGAALGLGYQISPAFGLRGDLSGIQGKGYLPLYGEGFKFNYGQLNLDATLDLMNLLGGYKSRLISPYVLAGVGGNLRFNNSEAQAIKGHFDADNYLWEKPVISVAGRAGVGVDIKISKAVKLTAEIATNLLSDHFNSKNGGAESKFDHQYQALVGLKFAFGQKSAPAPQPEPVVAPEPKPEPKPVVKEEPKPEPKPVVKEEPKPLYVSDNILFAINKWDIRPSEMPKINEIVKVMKEYPKASVTIVGHADKDTGTAARNLYLSEKRAEAVMNKLIELGVAKDRISSDFKGDKANQFSTPEANRVAVCVITE